MTISDYVMVAAVVLAPFIAVFAQRSIELWREKRNRRLFVFKTLMSTRASPVSREHVVALNMIDLEFTAPGDDGVRRAWKQLLDHFASFPREDADDRKEQAAVWNDKKTDYLVGLLQEMGKVLNYSFDPVQIKKGAYAPEAHAIDEMEQQALRRAMLDWLLGNNATKVAVVPGDEESAKFGDTFRKGMLQVLAGRKNLKVDVTSMPDVEQVDAAGAASPRR